MAVLAISLASRGESVFVAVRDRGMIVVDDDPWFEVVPL